MAITTPSEQSFPPDLLIAFRENLLAWHSTIERNMPWKGSLDPYSIWVSEIILQQTRVEQGTDYYHRFLKYFPDIETLAAASDEKVLSAWKGLGYYTRARNMLKAAKIISSTFEGELPRNHRDLLSLPGIGPYTAAAIASFAFNLPHAVVDGNVSRVLSRFFDISKPIDSAAGQKKIANLAGQCLYLSDPGSYNQAIMDFGALVCRPINPSCDACPQKKICRALLATTVNSRPVKSKRVNKKDRYFHYFLLRNANTLALRLREAKDIWKGLYEFPQIETRHQILEAPEKEMVLSELGIELTSEEPLDRRKHTLTHQNIHAAFYTARSIWPEAKRQWYDIGKLNTLPMPRLLDRFIKDQF